MAEASQPKRETRAERAAAQGRDGGQRLRPWVDAGMALPDWLDSLEDDPPPGEDTIPMIEPHAEAACYSRDALAHHFRMAAGRAAHVGFDLPVLFRLEDEHGVVHAGRLSPDVLVALGVEHWEGRREYDADALGAPAFVLEVLSKSTWRRDADAKLKTYAAIGVRECFLFDPIGEFPVPVLQGFALTKTQVRPLPLETLANGTEGVRSRMLGLAACVGKDAVPPRGPGAAWAQTIRWHDARTGQDLPTYLESRAEVATARREAAAARREAAAARAAMAESKQRQEELETLIAQLKRS